MVGRPAQNQPLDDDRGNQILIPVASGLQELIFGRPGLFVDRPGFVAGPSPETGLAKAVQAITRFNCREWAAEDKSRNSVAYNQGAAEVCSPYLQGLNEEPTDGFAGVPFEGGQCAAVYLVNITTTSESGVQETFTVAARGPVGGVRVREREDGVELFELNASGLVFSSACIGVANTGQQFYLLGSTDGPGDQADIRINSVSICSGTDICGNPPPVYRPPATVTPTTPLPPNITIDIPGVGPITVTIEPGPGGNPSVCAPDLGVCIPVGPTSPVNPDGDGGSDPPPPGDVGAPGSPEGTGSGGEAEGEAPPGSVLVGLKLDLLQAPVNAREFAPGVYRAAAYIYMGTPAGLDQDYAGSQLTDGQFVYAEKDNLTRWKVSANLEFSWRVTPYYREVE